MGRKKEGKNAVRRRSAFTGDSALYTCTQTWAHKFVYNITGRKIRLKSMNTEITRINVLELWGKNLFFYQLNDYFFMFLHSLLAVKVWGWLIVSMMERKVKSRAERAKNLLHHLCGRLLRAAKMVWLQPIRSLNWVIPYFISSLVRVVI